MRVEVHIEAKGHPKVTATHKTTFEITKDNHLTQRGNCIIAVSADKGPLDLPLEFKEIIRNDEARVTVQITVDGISEVALGFGSSKLLLTHPTDLVARRSAYACDRTLMIYSSKSAFDLSSELVELLRKPSARVEIKLTAEA